MIKATGSTRVRAPERTKIRVAGSTRVRAPERTKIRVARSTIGLEHQRGLRLE
jgi:hypothetical protein